MSVSVSKLREQNETAQLAAHFNEFYLQTTSPSITQIGSYRIVQEVGEGAFGKVYLAEHVLLHCQVVLKCGLLEDPNIVREIYYHKELRHRNIVKLYEVIKTETHLWMVLEYCEGNELYYHIYEKKRLDIASCKNLFYQVVEAIRYVHSLNLSHRDLKLENILMADVKKTVVKLTDFGFVREFNPYKRSLLSTVCGTTSYMAPEVLKNEKYSGFAIDVWSMGVILYAMVYGQLPFDEDDDMKTKLKIIGGEPTFQDCVPGEVNSLLKQMLSKDPAKRPSVSEILNSSFLIDVTNVKSEKRAGTESDSFVSINQYYNVHSMPFQSRMEKDLLKKLRKGNIDIESLVSSKMNGHTNALTAFYDLALKCEFEKQKHRKVKKKRYYEARKQISRSKKRVKSVLSLSEQNCDGQPLEKILTSLSIASASKNDYSPSATNMTRKSSDNTTVNTAQLQRRVSLPKSSILNESLTSENLVSTPYERSVSFFTDNRRSSANSILSGQLPKAKSKHILEKLQFWKKNKRRDGDSSTMDISSSNSQLSSPAQSNPSESGLLEINVTRSSQRENDALSSKDLLTSDAHENGDAGAGAGAGANANANANADADADANGMSGNENGNGNGNGNGTVDDSTLAAISSDALLTITETDVRFQRKRPDSVVSQFSQLSQTSHLYTMSESELDMMDGTDLDDDYYDDYNAYESSLNVSMHDFPHRPMSLASSSSRGKRRPANFRISSDTSILSSSTSVTRRKNGLSRVSSNSSDDSSALLKPSDREDGLDSQSPSRPASPRNEPVKAFHGKPRPFPKSPFSSKIPNGHIVAPSPAFPQPAGMEISRSVSPPAGARLAVPPGSPSMSVTQRYRSNLGSPDANGFNIKLTSHPHRGLSKYATTDAHTWRRDSPVSSSSLNVFERKFISINEEEEEEEVAAVQSEAGQ